MKARIAVVLVAGIAAAGVMREASIRNLDGPATYLFCTASSYEWNLRDGIYAMDPPGRFTKKLVHVADGVAHDCLSLY